MEQAPALVVQVRPEPAVDVAAWALQLVRVAQPSVAAHQPERSVAELLQGR